MRMDRFVNEEGSSSRAAWAAVTLLLASGLGLLGLGCSSDSGSARVTLNVGLNEQAIEVEVDRGGTYQLKHRGVTVGGQSVVAFVLEQDGEEITDFVMSFDASETGALDGDTASGQESIVASDDVNYVTVELNWLGGMPEYGWNWSFDSVRGNDVTSFTATGPIVATKQEVVVGARIDGDAAEMVVFAGLGDATEVELEYDADTDSWQATLTASDLPGIAHLWMTVASSDGGLTVVEKGIYVLEGGQGDRSVEAALIQVADSGFQTYGSPVQWTEDWDADNVSDHLFVDTVDLNRFPEVGAIDADQDGEYEEYWVNLDYRDGFDLRVVDSDGDQQMDRAYLNFNGNHFATEWTDGNADGIVDEDELSLGAGLTDVLEPRNDPREGTADHLISGYLDEFLHKDTVPCPGIGPSHQGSMPEVDSNGSQAYEWFPGRDRLNALAKAKNRFRDALRDLLSEDKCGACEDTAKSCVRDAEVTDEYLDSIIECGSYDRILARLPCRVPIYSVGIECTCE